MQSERRKRRLKRDVMQNTMTLRGWVPIKYKEWYGIYNTQHNLLVLRRWVGAWRYQCSVPLQPFEGAEIAWRDVQLRWIHALRAAAIQRGWM